jgi:hypothetical protein
VGHELVVSSVVVAEEEMEEMEVVKVADAVVRGLAIEKSPARTHR